MKMVVLAGEELEQTWEDFLAMRIKIRKPATDRAQKILLKTLEALSGGSEQAKITILERSIVNNWLDIYPLRQDPLRQDTDYRPYESA